MADFSIGALVALAGSNPWTIAETVTDGDPGAVTAAGAVFHAAAQRAADVSRLGETADATVAAAFANNRRPVYDAGQSAGLTRALLSGNGESMEEVARVMDVVAAELGAAAGNARTELRSLTDEINAIIARRNEFMSLNRRTLTSPRSTPPIARSRTRRCRPCGTARTPSSATSTATTGCCRRGPATSTISATRYLRPGSSRAARS